MHESKRYKDAVRGRSVKSQWRECVAWKQKLERATPGEFQEMKKQAIDEMVKAIVNMAEAKGWTIERAAEPVWNYMGTDDKELRAALAQWQKDHEK